MTEPISGRRERRPQRDAVLAFLAREGLGGVPETDSKRHRRLALLGGVSGLLLAIGLIERRFLPELDGTLALQLAYEFQRSGFLQLGALGLLITLALVGLRTVGLERARIVGGRPITPLLVKLCLALVSFLVAGEVFLRVAFWDGLSFGTQAGPIVRRFQRDFVFNRFDGPSRGPQVSGPKAAGAIRILVQGDSITWGQGVKSEESLYSTRLLRKLRGVDPGFEMAVLAKPGREIDGHLEQIRKWGGRLQPDLIVYQWYINDVEIDHQGRPAKTLPWRRLFFHDVLAHSSYLYFFLDHQASVFWPSWGPSYSDYILAEYGVGSAGWRRFEDEYRSWVREATSLTPRILIALYPHINAASHARVERIYDQVRSLSAELGVETIDLIESLTEFQHDDSRMYASTFDAHPSAEVHRLMAKALYGRVQLSWPELIASGRSP